MPGGLVVNTNAIVRFGSEGEILTLSRLRPLCRRDRTSAGHDGKSVQCQSQTRVSGMSPPSCRPCTLLSSLAVLGTPPVLDTARLNTQLISCAACAAAGAVFYGAKLATFGTCIAAGRSASI